ncbi:MAG: hypothetical protein WAM05_08535 [Candidatus Binataceae bacterium]
MGTVTTSAVSSVDPDVINTAAADAYRKQAKKPSKVTDKGLTGLWKHAQEFLVSLGGNYPIPTGTKDNDAVLLYLQALSDFLAKQLGQSFPGKPDPKILSSLPNVNHQVCILFLDSILQGLYAYRHKPFSRPPFAQGIEETDYFVGYVNSLGNVPVP